MKRRLRRNKLSEEVNNIESDKRSEAKTRKTEVDRLRDELAKKDAEMQNMRDQQDIESQLEGESGVSLTANTTLSTKVHDLEQQIVDLKAELQSREEVADATQDPDWTLAAKDPYNLEDDEEDERNLMITNYDDHDFTDMMDDEIMTTPTRLRTSFPSPPSTMPNTPSKAYSVASAGIQASLPVEDPENDILRAQLEILHSEISDLTSSAALNEDNHSRLTGKLADFIPIDESHDQSTLDVALDKVLTQLALAQSQSVEKSTAFSALSNVITALGFSTSSNPEDTITIIATQFRQARLDLEYLIPGEAVEGFENGKLLEMLVSRLRVLVKRVKEGDESIDQYHEQELLLRQQLGTRVDVHRQAERELHLANTVVGDLRNEISEKDVSNSRLQDALDGYRQEVSGLENLIETMERDTREQDAILRGEVTELHDRLQNEILKHDTTRACDEGNQILIIELERRLSAAMQAAAKVQTQITELASSNANTIAEKDAVIAQMKNSTLEREKEHGDALALRDARVAELRREVERVNEALKTAHSTILGLRQTNQALQSQVEGEKSKGQLIVQAMREQLSRVLETGMGYINGDVTAARDREVTVDSTFGPLQGLPPARDKHRVRREGSAPPDLGIVPEVVIRKGSFFDGGLARRRSSGLKKRRKYDSGLGFLEEEDQAMGEMI